MKIAYVFTEVPRMAGTFANAELDGMRARGVQIELFTLRRWGTRNDETERLEALFPVHRSPFLFSFALLRGFLAELGRRPGLVLSTLGMIVRDAAASPRVLVKSIAIFPKAILFGRMVRTNRYDLIHAYWASLPALAATVMSRISGVPFTMWAHASSDIYHRSYQTDRALSARLREARLVFTCHGMNLRHFEALCGTTILGKVIHQTHGVDLTRFRPGSGSADKAGTVVITAVGRMVPVKGFNILVDACELLHGKGYDFRCRIVGPGRPEAVLCGRPYEGWLPERVEFVGEVEHEALSKVYHDTHIFVSPSIIDSAGARDGLPNVLLEAMASGVACIGTSVGSIPEVILDGKTGLIVPPGDAAALAGALETLVTRPDLREELGREGAGFVRARYDREASLDRLVDLLQSACPPIAAGAPKARRG